METQTTMATLQSPVISSKMSLWTLRCDLGHLGQQRASFFLRMYIKIQEARDDTDYLRTLA